MFFAGCTAHKKTTAPSEWIDLFNGKNLDGWYVYIRNTPVDLDSAGVFTVDDKMLHVSGKYYG